MSAALRLQYLCMVLLATLFVAGCGTPRTLELAASSPRDVLNTLEIFVATTREAADQPQYFDGERAQRLSFAKIEITVPQTHKAGSLELPERGPPDPAQHFAVTKVERLDLAPVVAEVKREIQRRPASQRDVLVFVHGYNTNFADAAYRFAQIVQDSGFRGVPVLFTWPSRGSLLQYPYDRESAFYSRDFLETNLRAIARELGPSRIDILAHSMGSLLAMEAVRQATIRGDGSFGGKLRDVILASPDIDADVFRSQMRQIRRPVTVFVSADDRALYFSRRFAGDKPRVGALSEADADIVAKLEADGATIIDLSKISTSDGLNHAKFAGSTRVVQLIGRRLQADGGIALAEGDLGDNISLLAGGVVDGIRSTARGVASLPAAAAAGAAPRP